MCRFCARKRSETCLAVRYLWAVGDETMHGVVMETNREWTKWLFCRFEANFNRASESVEQVSLFVHANLAVIFIEHGKTIIWGIIKYHK